MKRNAFSLMEVAVALSLCTLLLSTLAMTASGILQREARDFAADQAMAAPAAWKTRLQARIQRDAAGQLHLTSLADGSGILMEGTPPPPLAAPPAGNLQATQQPTRVVYRLEDPDGLGLLVREEHLLLNRYLQTPTREILASGITDLALNTANPNDARITLRHAGGILMIPLPAQTGRWE